MNFKKEFIEKCGIEFKKINKYCLQLIEINVRNKNYSRPSQRLDFCVHLYFLTLASRILYNVVFLYTIIYASVCIIHLPILLVSYTCIFDAIAIIISI